MVKHSEVAVRRDSVAVEFDDVRLVANAGLILTSTLINRLGLERLVDRMVDLGQRPGAAKPGRKVCALVHAMALGADSIDDCEMLRAGGSEALLGHRVMAPSTLGTFLRSFSFGHVRQLDRVLAESIGRAWSAGAGPGCERLVIDIDSFVAEKGCRYSIGVTCTRSSSSGSPRSPSRPGNRSPTISTAASASSPR